MSARKYATTEDMEGVRAEVARNGDEVKILHIKVDQVRSIFDLNGDLSPEAAAGKANQFWTRLVDIAKNDEKAQTQSQAWTMVREDIARRLHLRWFHDRIGERFTAALLGGLGFTVAGKLADVFGVFSAAEHALHALGH